MQAMRETLSISWILLRFACRSGLTQLTNANKHKSRLRRILTFLPLLLSFLIFMRMSIGMFRTMTDSKKVEDTLKGWDLPACASAACENILSSSTVWPEILQLFWLGIVSALLLLLLITTIMPYSALNATNNQELEWIRTFPVRLRAYLWGKLFQSTLTNIFFLILVLPILVALVLLRKSNIAWALPAAVFVCYALAFMGTAMGMTLEVLVSSFLSPKLQRQVRTILMTLSTMSLVTLMMYFPLLDGSFWISIYKYGPWLQNTWIMRFFEKIFQPDFPGFEPFLGLLLVSLGVAILHNSITEKLLYRSLPRADGHERSARREPTLFLDWTENLDSWPVMVRRELQTFIRNFVSLILCLIVPWLFYFMSLEQKSDPSASILLVKLMLTPVMLLTFSAFSFIQAEMSAFWLYASTPRSLRDIIRERQKIWRILALIIMLPLAWYILPLSAWSDTEFMLRYALSIPVLMIFARYVQQALIFCVEVEGQNRSLQRLPMTMGVFLGIALLMLICVGEAWTVVSTSVLFAAMVWAMEQKARAHEPYALDPNAVPPARAGLEDGLIAALLLILLTRFFALFATMINAPAHMSFEFGFLIASPMVLAGLSVYHRYRQATGMPAYFGPIAWRHVLFLVLAVLVVAVGHQFWNEHSKSWTFLDSLYSTHDSWISRLTRAPWQLLLITGLITPFATEYIFRGLIFRGMLQRFGLGVALLLSSLLPTLCYPPQNFGFVLLLGLASAGLFYRTKVLWPSILLSVLAHMINIFWS